MKAYHCLPTISPEFGLGTVRIRPWIIVAIAEPKPVIVQDGELFSLVGPNGAGKIALIQMAGATPSQPTAVIGELLF